MSKKNKSGLDNFLIQEMNQNYEKAAAQVNMFYPDGSLANITPSSEKAPLAPLLAQAKQPPAPQTPTQEQLLEKCQHIRDNIKQGKTGNIEIQFCRGRQLSDKQIFPLGNTVVKILPMDTSAQDYTFIFIKSGDTLDASVFLGGDNASGIMVIKDENGEECFLRISEFHLLSLRENPNPRKEVGLMTSFLWLTAKVYTSIIFATNLFPVKNLLLSEWLQKEWQRAKDSASNPSSEIVGGESNA